MPAIMMCHYLLDFKDMLRINKCHCVQQRNFLFTFHTQDSPVEYEPKDGVHTRHQHKLLKYEKYLYQRQKHLYNQLR